MITEEQLQRQLTDEFNPMAALVGMNLTVTQERQRIMKDMRYSHDEGISVDLNLTSRVFSGYSGFFPHQKPTHAVLSSCIVSRLLGLLYMK